jgi:hypothetical protein
MYRAKHDADDDYDHATLNPVMRLALGELEQMCTRYNKAQRCMGEVSYEVGSNHLCIQCWQYAAMPSHTSLARHTRYNLRLRVRTA